MLHISLFWRRRRHSHTASDLEESSGLDLCLEEWFPKFQVRDGDNFSFALSFDILDHPGAAWNFCSKSTSSQEVIGAVVSREAAVNSFGEGNIQFLLPCDGGWEPCSFGCQIIVMSHYWCIAALVGISSRILPPAPAHPRTFIVSIIPFSHWKSEAVEISILSHRMHWEVYWTLERQQTQRLTEHIK